MLNEVFVQNSGAVGGSGGDGDFSSPAAVPDGVIAFFPADGGNSIDISNGTNNKFEDQGPIQVVRGTPDGPIVTNVVDPSEITVESQAYTAPRKQVDHITPVTLSSDTRGIGFKVTSWDMNDQEPYERHTYDTQILSGDTTDDIIDKLIQQVLNLPVSGVNNEGYPQVYAGSDQVSEVVPSSGSASGQAVVTIDGTDYDITWDTDKTTTVSNFIADHEAAIWAAHGIRIQENTSDNNLELWYVNTDLQHSDIGTSDGSSTALSLNEQSTRDNVRLEAREYGDTFQTSVIGSWSPTVSTNQDFREGTGSYEQIKDMEEYVHGFQGRYQVDDGILGRQEDLPVFAVTGNTYDLIILRSPNDVDRSVNKMADPQDIVLALETGVDKTHVNSFFGNQGVSL